jgi:hypothetical protein
MRSVGTLALSVADSPRFPTRSMRERAGGSLQRPQIEARALILDEFTSSAAHLIEETEASLVEDSGVIANGYLRLDPQEWVRAVEKRAALGR